VSYVVSVLFSWETLGLSKIGEVSSLENTEIPKVFMSLTGADVSRATNGIRNATMV
jgi:hypothetical protein